MSRKPSKERIISEEDLNRCEYNLSMAQLKDPKGAFAKMPKSLIVDGKRIPRSALRKRDLCRFYLLFGGTIPDKVRRKIKNYTVPKKPSVDQVRFEKLQEQRSLDHKPNRAKESIHKNDKHKRRASVSPSKHASSIRRQLNNLKLNSTERGTPQKKIPQKTTTNKNEELEDEESDGQEQLDDDDWESTTDDADY